MSNDPWVAPPEDWLVFTNCTAGAYWLAAFVDQRYRDTSEHDAPVVATYQYVRSVMPSNITEPDFGQAVAWYNDLDVNTTVWRKLYQFPLFECPTELCKQLRWGGDPDLAGIGVMAVYYLAAIFSTLYFLVLSLERYRRISGNSPLRRLLTKITIAFRESLHGFIDAGQLFAIAMLVASCYRHGSSRIHPDKTHSIYGLENSSYLAVFAIFPPLLLQMVATELRRRKTRVIMWAVITVLAITVSALYLNLGTSVKQVLNLLDRDSATTDVFWQLHCDPEDLRGALDFALFFAEILLVLNLLWWLYRVAPVAIRSWVNRRVSKHRAWNILDRSVKVLNGFLCFAVMWTMLGLFNAYRLYFGRRMGSTNQDNQWSFGQIFALATWAPVAIDLISIFVHGAKDGLEGKVSERYHLVEAPPTPVTYLDMDPLQVPAEPQYSQVLAESTDGRYDKA